MSKASVEHRRNSKGSNMIIPTIFMAVLAIIFLVIGYSKGDQSHIAGFKISIKMMVEVVPLLFFAFLLAGMMQTLLPHEAISKWIGAESGFRGIMLGCLAGAITPGGPFVTMPLAAGIYRAGASPGTMVGFLTSWSLWAVARLPMEVGILGWRLTLMRMVSTLVFPPLAGVLANLLFNR